MGNRFPAMPFSREVLIFNTPFTSMLGRCLQAVLMFLLVAVAGCGQSDVAQLTEQLSHEDEDVRYDAIKTLEDMGDAAKSAVPALAAALRDQDPKIRYRAAKALSKIGANASVVPELSGALRDTNPDVVYYAAKSLEELGSDAKLAVPDLIAALENKSNEKAHYFVLKTLGKIGPDAAEAVPAVKRAMESQDPKVRDAAASALRRLEKTK
jgi:HEAT repeat protein